MEIKTIKIAPAKLRAAREDRTLQHVANEVGISRQRLWRYENGVDEIPSNVLARLCVLYERSIEDFIVQSPVFLPVV